MSKIRIKNFGPIKRGCIENNGWIDIKKNTIFIGNQASGKSTIAKVISTLTWLEKAINREDIVEPKSLNDFQGYFKYQSLKSYFNNNTEIEYEGDLYNISYNTEGHPYTVTERKNNSNYVVPKVMYVPAERNFLSVIKNATGVRGLPEPLFEFAEELRVWQNESSGGEIPLPINGVNYQYDAQSESSFIIGEDYNVNLQVASSGFQSLVPLFLVSLSLANQIKSGSKINPDNISVNQSVRMNSKIGKIMIDQTITDSEKIIMVEEVKSKFQNKGFINIVEEPEQNLFPTSQWQLLKKLIEFNNMNDGNKLIMTTHSPYLINYITLAVEASSLKNRVHTAALKVRLERIVPSVSTIKPKDLVIYELDEKEGTISLLANYKGLPSDENKLNENLAYSNEMFSELLEIENLCQ